MMTPPRNPSGRSRTAAATYQGAESVPQPPQTTPSAQGFGLHSHDFTLQSVMELQKSVGELNANISSMKSSIDGMKAKVEDLVGWKNKVLGGAAALLFLGGLLGWAASKVSSYIELRPPVQHSTQADQPARPTGK